MRTTFFIFVLVHALLHLFGFVKAFDISVLNKISQPISKPLVLIWSLAFLCFILVAIPYLLKNNFLWFFGIIAVVRSQIRIIYFCKDAKFGTLANIIVLFAALPAYGNFVFDNSIKKEQKEKIPKSSPPDNKPVTPEDIKLLSDITHLKINILEHY
jgi:hypothetical protein